MTIQHCRALACIATILLGHTAVAQDLSLSRAEFATWPEYCQARYVTVPPGQYSEWAPTYPRAKIDAARRLLGPATFERVHHYCYGLVWFAQSKLIADPRQKQFALQKAEDEVIFTYGGLASDSPIIGPSLVLLGQICIERGQDECAVENLRKAIAADQTEPSAYSALAVFYRKQKKLELARDTLLEGDRAVGGASAEIHYNLGLIYLDLGNADAALASAQTAYRLGYPLPGLRNRLQRLGKWPSP